jgi:electron transfer flavoprotein alpha subunit
MTNRRRRDPRAERIKRRADQVATSDTSARRDPRAERDAGRGLIAAPVSEAAEAAKTVRPASDITTIETPAFFVLVLADMPDGRLSPHDRDVLGAARGLADRDGGAVAVLAPVAAAELGAAGADRALASGVTAGSYQPERLTALARAAVEMLNPRRPRPSSRWCE